MAQDSQHPNLAQCNEHDEPITSAIRSRSCRSAAARLESKARSPGGLSPNMKTVLPSSVTSNITTKSAESRDLGQYWGTAVKSVSGGKGVKELVVGTVKVSLGGVRGHFFELA